MSIPATEAQETNADLNQSLKLAIATTLLRSKLLHNHNQQPPPPTNSHAARTWKRKAKQRKQEIIRLKEDLKLAEDSMQCDLFPQTANCKCYFFDNMGNLSPNSLEDGCDNRFNDVLRRRFLRQVRLNERKRLRDGLSQRLRHSEYNNGDDIDQLRSSVDFLVELCDTISPDKVETNFANWSHQAVDFILAALKNLSSMGKGVEPVEAIICNLIMRLVKRMCGALPGQGSSHFDNDCEFYVQHIIRKLGSDSYIGQRVILSISQQISVLAESLLFMDPFDEAFLNVHSCLYMMIQLIEFLVSDYFLTWSSNEGFEIRAFEEWVTSVLHARKGLELLESRNGLYVLYIDRVIGEVAKLADQVPSFHTLNSDILNKLFC